jgi:acyl carrier protein
MMTTTDFTRLLDDELGLDFSDADLTVDLDRLGEWDSVYLLRLIGALERATGQPLPVEDLLTARTLDAIRELTASFNERSAGSGGSGGGKPADTERLSEPVGATRRRRGVRVNR